MKIAFFTILLLLAPNHSDAACLEAVPFRELGPLKIGAMAPKKLGNTKVVKEEPTIDHRWFEAGSYRFRTGDQGTIEIIQFTPPSTDFCYVVGEKKIMASRSVADLAREFPQCLYEQRYGGDTLTCDGIRFLQGAPKIFGSLSPLRIDVDSRSLQSIQTEDAARGAQSAVRQEWPFRLGFPLPNRN
jgi:hypothetical protein